MRGARVVLEERRGGGGDALEGKGSQGRFQKRFDGRLEEVAEAVGGGYYRLQMPLKLAFAVRETVAGRRLGVLKWGGVPPPLPMHPWWGGGSGTRKFVYQKWPKSAFPFVNFIFKT